MFDDRTKGNEPKHEYPLLTETMMNTIVSFLLLYWESTFVIIIPVVSVKSELIFSFLTCCVTKLKEIRKNIAIFLNSTTHMIQSIWDKVEKGANMMEQEINAIVQWLQKQVDETNTNGLIVGVSGGLDSAVVAYLIQRACPDRSLAAIMPINTSHANMEDARKVVEGAGIDHV